MMALLKLMICGEAWAEKSAGHALVCLCTQIKHGLDKQDKVSSPIYFAECCTE